MNVLIFIYRCSVCGQLQHTEKETETTAREAVEQIVLYAGINFRSYGASFHSCPDGTVAVLELVGIKDKVTKCQQ